MIPTMIKCITGGGITHETSDSAYFMVPDQANKDIHIILEVADDGAPMLKRYERLIFKVN
jgi:hypothetical protein